MLTQVREAPVGSHLHLSPRYEILRTLWAAAKRYNKQLAHGQYNWTSVTVAGSQITVNPVLDHSGSGSCRINAIAKSLAAIAS